MSATFNAKAAEIAFNLNLTPREAEVVERLSRSKVPIQSEQLFCAVWGQQSLEVDKENLNVMIHRIRRKLGSTFIRTRWGVGYFLSDEARVRVSSALSAESALCGSPSSSGGG